MSIDQVKAKRTWYQIIKEHQKSLLSQFSDKLYNMGGEERCSGSTARTHLGDGKIGGYYFNFNQVKGVGRVDAKLGVSTLTYSSVFANLLAH